MTARACAHATQRVDLRRAAAVTAGRLTGTASRLLGRGGGTALPGLVATRLDPTLLTSLSAQLSHGLTVLTGTNGKTTTARLLGSIAQAAGLAPLSNES